MTWVASLQHLEVHDQGRVWLVMLNRPRVHNACDERTHLEVQEVVRRVGGPEGEGVRALLLAGRGPSFCAGSDVRHTRELGEHGLRRYVGLDCATKDAVATCPVPTVAWVHGHALGGGLELALACDFRAVTGDAVLGLPEAALGTLPGAGGIQRLSHLAGPGVARDMVLLGRRLTGEEAHSLGLASWVVSGTPEDPATLREVLAPLLELDPLVVMLARSALSPTPALSSLERRFHELAAAAAHATGVFADKTHSREDGRSKDA